MTIHQRIMRAARRGTGLRLTCAEVATLSRDGTIATCAEQDDADQQADREAQNWIRLSRDVRCIW